METADQSLISVRTLGEFSINCGDRHISDTDGRTKKVWLLLEYLLTNRNKDLSMEQLAEAIWRDEEESDNPTNALKNLVYRARTLLKDLVPHKNLDYIVFSRNTYLWNKEIPCSIDVEEFEECCALGENHEADLSSRIDAYLHAIQLYQGEFLPKSSYADWVINKSAYYASLYAKAVEQVVGMLGQLERYEDIINVCETAVVLYPYNESIHYALMRAYMAAGHRRKAIAHYEYLSDFFYKKMGVTLSNSVRDLYKEMTSGMESIEADMDSIESDLRETDSPKHAFSCDYEIFKQMYRLQARSIARTGQSVHVGLLTVRDMHGNVPGVPLLQSVMTVLRDVALDSLRKGDIVSAYSSNQLVIMLPMTTYENGEMVLRRILAAFTRKHRTRDCFIDTKLREINPSAI
ncbi:MAG: AfsR/SARP family transcriptional regulator [Candidatus Merdivicinus sp.]